MKDNDYDNFVSRMGSFEDDVESSFLDDEDVEDNDNQ